MAAETARQFQALEAQAQTLMSVFARAGYEAVAPAIIQPAGVFLDVIGETLRARTYVFIDAAGDELCLRPDLTVPTCRLHLERYRRAGVPAKYAYNGPAFRFQPQGADAAHPREFRQAGIESFGQTDREGAEAELVATVLAALGAAGLKECRLRLGDLGLFTALLESIDMPPRWRTRLRHRFWQPAEFQAELARLSSNPAAGLERVPEALRSALDPSQPEAAEEIVARHLDASGIEPVGARTTAEIAAGLVARLADAGAPPLAPGMAKAVQRYLSVRAPASDAPQVIGEIAAAEGLDIGSALATFSRRLRRMQEAGVNVGRADFSAEFGRTLEYYTGLVFEVAAPGLGRLSPVAGGGRYDGLMRAAGADEDVPAVGAAIHTERLLAAVTGEIL